MPVHHGLGPDNRPAWCEVTSAGIFKVPRDGWFDRHYHDFNEYWLVFKGRAKVLSEGQEYVVGPGDILCTHAGDEHDVLEVYEELEAFWFEERLEGKGRLGHLHRSPELARGHRVPGGAIEEVKRGRGEEVKGSQALTSSPLHLFTSSAAHGPGAMLLSSLCFSAMGALVKAAGQGKVPAAESTFVRFTAGLVACLLLARAGVIRLEYNRRGLLLVRGAFGSVSALLFFGALTQTELGRATLLCYTYVLFSALFSAFALRERLRPGAFVALVVSIVGVGLITGAHLAGMGRGDALGLLSGVMGGVAITSIRELRKTETAYAIFVVFCAFGVVTSLLVARETWVLPRGATLWALCGIAVMGTGGQLLMTAAYRYCSVALGGLLSLMTVVLASLIGFLLFGEGMSLKTMAGSALVLGAAAYLTVLEAGGFQRPKPVRAKGSP